VLDVDGLGVEVERFPEEQPRLGNVPHGFEAVGHLSQGTCVFGTTLKHLVEALHGPVKRALSLVRLGCLDLEVWLAAVVLKGHLLQIPRCGPVEDCSPDGVNAVLVGLVEVNAKTGQEPLPFLEQKVASILGCRQRRSPGQPVFPEDSALEGRLHFGMFEVEGKSLLGLGLGLIKVSGTEGFKGRIQGIGNGRGCVKFHQGVLSIIPSLGF